MKKILTFIVSFVVALSVFGVSYDADTFGAKNQSNQGNLKVKYFSYANGTQTNAVNDTVILTALPAGARVVGGEIVTTAFGSSTVLDLGLRGADNAGEIKDGVNDDPDLFIDGADTSAGITNSFANLFEGNINAAYELGAKRVHLYATALGATWPTNQTITGVVYYIEP